MLLAIDPLTPDMRSERALSMLSKTKASTCRETSISKLLMTDAETDVDLSTKENAELSLKRQRSVCAPAKL